MTEKQDTPASGSEQAQRNNTDVFLSIPATGTEKNIPMPDWQAFLTELHEYAGEHFMTGADSLRVTYEGLLRASGIPIEASTTTS